MSHFLFFCDTMLASYYTCRAFRDVLKTDRDTYGVGEDYEIGDIVADDWHKELMMLLLVYSRCGVTLIVGPNIGHIFLFHE